MGDVIFIAVMLAFFVLCALYVQLCDRMIGPDELAMAVRGEDSEHVDEPTALVAARAGDGEVTA